MKSPTQLARELRKNQTPEEEKLWNLLRNRKLVEHKFLRQHVIVYKEINFKKNFFILDFYCAKKKLAVESDGGYHLANADYDILRDSILKKNKINVLRIKNEELQNEQLVLKKLIDALNK
jgi:very-short-patch-repair endonuclease